ncbi:proteasome lid subunit RPN8/RPN11 [Paenibacillus taihuensis]|uniref:Proteasome lid subunit RPN8/RPN11 n=1 Tax=Paenibacillus taihuensis TaxID=1156355 RepID=A0A3D9RWJ2_9BACL|nr:M67 family metallopeptidase [Paenibacillus taihuensis]REE84369.1 proteasome lid subunit RPN8/RPN11 [Paenibacillus taihuensis]
MDSYNGAIRFVSIHFTCFEPNRSNPIGSVRFDSTIVNDSNELLAGMRHTKLMMVNEHGHSPTLPTAAALAPQAQEQLLSICAAALPSEACGVLAGTIERQSSGGPLLLITHVYPVQNAAATTATSSANDRFEFDPASWIQTLYDMQKNRQSLVGYFHSHPQTPPIPSAADLFGIHSAAACDTSYWIISLADSILQPIIQPYWIHADRSGLLNCSPLMLTEVSI